MQLHIHFVNCISHIIKINRPAGQPSPGNCILREPAIDIDLHVLSSCAIIIMSIVTLDYEFLFVFV